MMTALNQTKNDIDMQVVTSSSDKEILISDVSMYSIDTHLTEQDQDQDCTQEQEPKQRSVRFSVVEEFEYEKLDLTEELRDQLWYTMEDMVALAKHELRLCEESSSGANKKNGRCWRGFEHMQGGRDNRAERVAAVIDSILDAYDELAYDSDQYKTEDDKAEALRQECRVLTRDDRKRAYKFGLKDQTVAETLQKTSASNSESKSSKRSKSSASNSKGDKTSSSSSSSSSNRGRAKEDERRLKRSKRSKEGVTATVKSSSSQQKQKPMVADPAMGSPERPPPVMAPIRCA